MAKGSKSSKPAGTAQSAITGRFVTQATARRHPDTTIVHRPKKGK